MSPSTTLLKELLDFQNQAWTSFQYHKDQQNKIVYWGAGFFIVVATAVNFFGTQNEGLDVLKAAITNLVYAFAFHMVYVSLLCFFLHHQLGGRFYEEAMKRIEIIFQLTERTLLHKHKIGTPHWLYRKLISPRKVILGHRSVPNFAGTALLLLIYVVFLFKTAYLQIDSVQVEAVWKILIYIGAVIVFVFPVLLSWHSYEKSREKMNKELDNLFSPIRDQILRKSNKENPTS